MGTVFTWTGGDGFQFLSQVDVQFVLLVILIGTSPKSVTTCSNLNWTETSLVVI